MILGLLIGFAVGFLVGGVAGVVGIALLMSCSDRQRR